MANPILDLLAGAASAGPVAGPQATAPTPTMISSPIQAMGLPSSDAKYVEHDGKHNGIAGVARDILGHLGDFLLTRLHMPAMYAPAQEQRQLHIAEQGYGTNPQATADALSRIGDLNQPYADKLREQYADNQRTAAYQDNTAEARAARVQQVQEQQNDRSRGVVAAYFNSLGRLPEDKRATAYSAIRQKVLGNYTGQPGLDLEKELPETYDPDMTEAFISSHIPASVQRAQVLTKERIDNQADQAATRDETNRRGQDLLHEDRGASRQTTERGQDLAHGDRVATQNNTANRNAEDKRHHMFNEGKFVPDPNHIYVQGGKNYKYNPSTKKFEQQ